MNTVAQGYLAPTNDFQLNYCPKSVFPEENRHVFGYKLDPGFNGYPRITNGSSPVGESCSEQEISKEFSVVPRNGSSPVLDSSSSEGEVSEEIDHSDAILKFISQMLMEEEDLGTKPCMLHDCLALQATEKSLFDVLNNNSDGDAESPSHVFTKSCSISSSGSSLDVSNVVESAWNPHSMGDFESLVSPAQVQYPSLDALSSSWLPLDSSKGSSTGTFWASDSASEMQFLNMSSLSNGEVSNFELFNDGLLSNNSELYKKTSNQSPSSSLREKKNRYREESDSIEEHRSSKQSANNVAESEPLEMYDNVLLCGKSQISICGDEDASEAKKLQQHEQPKRSNRGRPKGGKKNGIVKEVVDLRSLLMQCAQAVASYDNRTVNDLLMRIRQHSSPQGDGTERLAHYFANALDARLAGAGTASYTAYTSMRISAAEILKAYKTFITACPFKKMSNLLANKTIVKLATGATTLHIVDFGILYGFQWPCLIQALSERPGGPPKLRITGIDFPQPGFRPAERVGDTGRRLAKYCERFKVPFEYNAIAQKWETIRLEDLKIEKNELLVVNSLYRLHNVPDETVMVNSPRDAVLNLIKKINPDMFIHGVVNGTYNTPFFVTRFREALFHFSSMFDMFEANISREDPHRRLFEEQVFGKDAMNIIACEGTERVERPETYKQWQVRNQRAGFRQLALDQEIVKYVRSKVKTHYHKDFSVDEDGKWMLQGWKGRVIHAISYWQPAHK
ncbi:UNVERIFIED_CONTAM: Scarecrow-like protein 14 [Sesamum angustifolium]|uniref:Scarecrow-like protein 14 n=1 Tax=Sesamum angustifolium TaxID=2727405 RepID=A0AAW2QQA1_9LAMI